MSGDLETFPALADWITDYCSQHTDPFIRDSGRMIAYCFELDAIMPDRYGWRFSSEESFSKQIDGVRDPRSLNKIYWTDMARNVEAYSTMTFWRGLELLKPAIRSLNIREIITPAVLARSLIELCCTFLRNANILEKTFTEISFPKDTVVNSPELEKMVVRIIWGTRYGDPQPHLKQTNVLNSIQWVSKNPKGKDVLPTYEYLCDIAHPSFIGNTRFWSHIEEVLPDSSERRVISKYADRETTLAIVDKILWSLGWSAAVLRNGFEITKVGLAQLLTKLGDSEHAA